MSGLDELGHRLASDDRDERARALGDLVDRGSEAAPVLAEAATSPSADVRTLAMEGLGTVADPSTSEVVRRGLEDPDGRVRSLAAVALLNLGDDDAVDALMATLDDWPDLLHSEMSRSAYALPAAGPPVIPRVAPLLASERREDRAKAAWILRNVLDGRPDDADLAPLRDIVAGYDPRGTHDEQAAAARAVAEWADR